MAKKKEKEFSIPDELKKMRQNGVEQMLPPTGRILRLKAVDAPTLLREGKMPDILTPLVVKSVYQDLSDNELRQFVEQQKGSPKEALDMLEAMDFIAKHTIADGTKVEDLTIPEKRWLFRLVMGAAEMLVTFRYEPNLDVEPVDEEQDVPQATE